MKRRALSVFWALALCLTLLPTAALAEGAVNGVAQIGNTVYTTLSDAVTAAQDGATITLLSDIDNAGKSVRIIGENKTVTLDLNGHTISEGRITVGINQNNTLLTPSTLKITGSGSFITSGNITIGAKGTLDLSGWTGGTISAVKPCKSDIDESRLIVGENAGTINALQIYNWPTAQINENQTERRQL